MSDEKKSGGALDGISIASLKAQAEKKKNGNTKSEETTEKKDKPEKDSAIFQWDDDTDSVTDTKPEGMPSISDLKNAKKEEVSEPQAPEPPTPVNPEEDKPKTPTKEELGGGIVIEQKDNANKKDGVNVQGPLAPGSESMKGVEQTLKEMDEMTKIAAKRAAATGEKRQAQTVVEVLIDKSGLTSIEFTDEERAKLKAAKKIKLTAVQDESLKNITMTKPKAVKQKHLIAKAFSKQFAPFVAAGSGYLGRMRNLSSLEVINLVTITDRTRNSADAILQRANLIYSKLEDCSIGNFENFDDFAKKTAIIDIDIMLYALIRATYPEEETIVMNCGNPKCTHKQRNAQGRVEDVPNQFTHKYRNSEVLLGHKMSEKLQAQVQQILDASYTKEDAIEAQNKSPLMQEKRYALGEDKEIIVDVCCPSIYDFVEDVAKKIDVADFRDDSSYAPATNLASFISRIMLKDEDSEDENAYNVFDDKLAIIDIIYHFSDELLELLQQIIVDEITTYQYLFGFKAESVVCPFCGQAFEEDAEIDVNRLLFLQAQHHMTNA